jgi:maltose O-acetyltransferase
MKRIAVQVLGYLTNHVVSHLPSFGLRHAWYRRVLGLEVGPGTRVFMGCYLWFYGPTQLRRRGLRVGSYTWINRNCCLDARAPLTIGSNVSISPEVMILTTGHRQNSPGFELVSKPVVIEDHVWIGTRAMIMPGVTLGRGCVVAAGAVVTHDVAPRVVVAGVPAREIGQRTIDPEYVLAGSSPLLE